MGEAREVLDQLTTAGMERHNIDEAVANYTDDAVMTTPDAGEISGHSKIGEYWRPFIESFPDGRYETLRKFETGDTAIDEGWFVGTHTAPLSLPTGEVVPPTGRQVRIRSCDIATVAGGKIKEHHLYFDQVDFLGQLGFAPTQ